MIEKVKELITRLPRDIKWRDFSCEIDNIQVSVFYNHDKRIAHVMIGSVPFGYTEHTISLEVV